MAEFLFHHGWRFLKTGILLNDEAAERTRDRSGHLFSEPEYDDSNWETVTLPHTFNGSELFSAPIQDAGTLVTRCVAYYRNHLLIPPEHQGDRVLITFEGVRQSCYVYVNGSLAGYYEAGVGPFGFELTRFIDPERENTVAIAVNNASTREIPFCVAETPNAPAAKPGSFVQPQDDLVPPEREGVGYEWNCNDFNPVLGGLSRPVKIFFKKDVYLTLPVYANLGTRGTYVYGSEFDPAHGEMALNVEAEIRNTRETDANITVTAELMQTNGDTAGVVLTGQGLIRGMKAEEGCIASPLTRVPEDAYRFDTAQNRFVPAEENEVRPTDTRVYAAQTVKLSGRAEKVIFWSPSAPQLYQVRVRLFENGQLLDETVITTGFREVKYDPSRGILLNGRPIWLRGYAQRATNEWAAVGIVPEWMRDMDALLLRESRANHIRFMHVAAYPEDIRACDRHGIVVTQPAGDKEKEVFGRQWDQRMELMRNVLIFYRNHPSILFWEAGNNSISAEHMREMTEMKRLLDPLGGRFMGCRTLNTEDTVKESEYIGTMLNRHASSYFAKTHPVMETEYSREEAAGRLIDDFTPPDFDYRNRWIGHGGVKQKLLDFHDHNGETLALANAGGYSEFFNDRLSGASGKNLYSGCAALCWTDSAQHGRQCWSENGRMSGRVDPLRQKKHSFSVYRVMQSALPDVFILGHRNYPPDDGSNYFYPEKAFNGKYWEETGKLLKRDPHHKTVYCVASYPVAKVELRVNGNVRGVCTQPEKTFIFPFENVDILENGPMEAIGFDQNGREVCRHRIQASGVPKRLVLQVKTAPGGFRADGNDLFIADVSAVDEQGNRCILCDSRVDLTLNGDARLMGGYNSGRFDGNGRHDSVAGKDHVYLENGIGRVLVKAGLTPGTVTLTARAPDLSEVTVSVASIGADTGILTQEEPAVIWSTPAELADLKQEWFEPLPKIDRIKYKPEDQEYCKIMLDGQEPDFRGIRAVNRNGRVWGNVLCILERMKRNTPGIAEYEWDASKGSLKVTSEEHVTQIRIGETHLVRDGQEELMDGAPYLAPNGIPVMEAAAVFSGIPGVKVMYDERIKALRIETINRKG